MTADPNTKLGPPRKHLMPVRVGSFVEQYPAKAWTQIPRDVSMEDLWSLVGPQVDMHMNKLPLWKVFCVVYFEGLMHGAAAMKEKSS